jgi:hypothetical protein
VGGLAFNFISCCFISHISSDSRIQYCTIMMVHNINKQMNSIAHITEHDSAYGSPQSQWFTSSGYQAASQHMPVEETATAAGVRLLARGLRTPHGHPKPHRKMGRYHPAVSPAKPLHTGHPSAVNLTELKAAAKQHQLESHVSPPKGAVERNPGIT